MKEINPDAPLPVVEALDAAAMARVSALVERQRNASGILMQVVSFAGNRVEDAMKYLPKPARRQFDATVREALMRSYSIAARSRLGGRLQGDRMNKALATMSGALGGIGGLPTALAEIPIATMVIFRAVQGVAESYGEDPTSEEVRAECLRVFGSGGPGDQDDGIDTTFVGARLSLSGPAVHRLISLVAPRFAAVLGQKLASQAIPVLGAAAGAGTNYAFIDYYVDMAHVHFGLRKLARDHGETEVIEAFHRVLSETSVPLRRA